MAAAVSLRAVVDELDALPDECTAYLNRETGELLTLRDDEARLVEEDIDATHLPQWQRDDLPRIREVLESNDWIPLPSRFDMHEWAFMDRFASSVDDPAVSDELRDAIRGAGAFRNFKDAVFRHGIQQDWCRFKAAELGRIAVDWLGGFGIACVRDDDAATGGPA
ncbi:MAG: UPF0158 family protein [Actinomycetota bacterium]|nr:UPF0158 family protein [Actinomycetota bacterium]